MAFLFGSAPAKHAAAPDADATFHGDESLHDSRPGVKSWFQSLSSDVPAALRLAAGKFGVGLSGSRFIALLIDFSTLYRPKQRLLSALSYRSMTH